MAAGDIVPVPGAQFEETLASASPDVLREMIREFAQRMMDADVEVACNAGYGEVTPDRVNSRNGYRRREWDTRAGTIELAIPKLRTGRTSRRSWSTAAAPSGRWPRSWRPATCWASRPGGWRSWPPPSASWACPSRRSARWPRSWTSWWRASGPGRWTPGRTRSCWIDALTQKVREGGRTVNVHCLIATGVNADGYREILGIDVTSSEDGAGWLAFLRGLAARGLSGVALVTSDDHAGLVNAIAAVLPGAAWQRCRTHYHRNLLTRVPKTAQPWVSTLVRTIFEQPDPASVRAQHAQVVAALEAKLPQAAAHLDEARDDILAFTAFPREVWRQIWSNNPAGAAEQGGPQPHRRGRHLPRPRRHHPPGRRGAGRAERRMDRIPPLHGPGNPRRLPESRPGRYGKE